MKITTTKTLMTVSFVTLMGMTAPAFADSSVICSLRQSTKGAAYQSGVDVHGKPVASTDVGGSTGVGKTLNIPLTVDLAQSYNAALPAGSKLETQVGLVQIQPDGKVIIDGKDVTAATDTVCASAGTAAPVDTTINGTSEDAVAARNKAAALRTIDAPKKAKVKKKKAPAATVSSDTPPVEAAPAATVDAPVSAPAPTPAPAPAAAPAPTPPAPQVLDAAPPPPPMPAATPAPAPQAAVPQPTPVAPPGPEATPTPPPSGAIVSPTEGTPRPPIDPLAPPAPPAPGTPPADGTLSGGAQ